MIDLRSDASSLPSPDVLRAMVDAELGNDDFREDPTINALESRVAELLGKESALFVQSGTMGNMTGVMSQTAPGDALLIGKDFHLLTTEERAMRRVAQVDYVLADDGASGAEVWLKAEEAFDAAEREGGARPRLLCLENTVNRLGGLLMPLGRMRELRAWAVEHGLRVHLDGARFFNAVCALGVAPHELASCVDTVMLVFTKSLGAPAGAALVGDAETIEKARLARWMLGGGWKQGGVIAGACLAALDGWEDRVAEDHANARRLAEGLDVLPGIGVDLERTVSNIVLMRVTDAGIDSGRLKSFLEDNGARIGDFKRGNASRLVTHRNIGAGEIDRFIELVERGLGGALLAQAQNELAQTPSSDGSD